MGGLWNYTLTPAILTGYAYPDSIRGSLVVPANITNPMYVEFEVTKLVQYMAAHPSTPWGLVWVPAVTAGTAAVNLNSYENHGADSNLAYVLDASTGIEAPALNAASAKVALTVMPNPFNSSTAINFSLPAGSHAVSSSVYGLNGRLVNSLLSTGVLSSGKHRLVWSPVSSVPSGLYVATVNVDGKTYRQRVMLSR
jgi:hypothetical protein